MKQAIKIFIKKVIPFAITKNQRYDRDTLKIMNRLLKNNSNSIDIGCHKGEVLDEILKRSPNGKHFGVEPIPFLAKKLKEKYNSRCEILEYALNDEEPGETNFVFVKSNPAYSGLKERSYEKVEETETIIVKTSRLDRLIPAECKIDFIKIDVEGGEYGVLRGAERILSNYHPAIIFEHGLGAADKYNTTPEMIFEFLNSIGYKLNSLNGFLKKQPAFSKEDFKQQFYQSKNYYFIATK